MGTYGKPESEWPQPALVVDLYLKVRLARRGGMSERQAASHFGISRASVKKMMMFSVPPGYQRTAQIKRPKLDGFTGYIDQWLQDDLNRPRKQRHTAKRIFERLRDEHQFRGGYTTVKNYVREHGRRSREMFVPLAHAPRCPAAYACMRERGPRSGRFW